MAFAKILDNLKNRKRRAENGLYNCLPFPFERFRIFFPGIEQGQFVLITANEKVKFNLI